MLYGYEIPGHTPFSVTGDPAVGRLTRAGLVHTQGGFAGGAFLSSGKGVHKAGDFGQPERTAEGWVFYPPAEVPPLDAIGGPLALAPGNHRVPLRLGGELIIRPAYLEPRLVFSGGSAETHPTHYGRIARTLRDKIRNGQAPALDSPECLAVIQAAIAVTYPGTPELLDAINRAHPFLTDDDLQPILDAVFSAPFPQPAAAG